MGVLGRGRADIDLSAGQLGELVGELAPLVRGRTLRDVEARPPADLVLVLESADAAVEPRILRVRLSADPAAPRLHVEHARGARHEGPLGPFFRRAVEDLPGGTVAGISQVAGDRVALIELRDPRAGERRALALELFGRRANLALLGPGDRVVAVLVPPAAGKAEARLVPGEVWRAPGAGARAAGAPRADSARPPPAALAAALPEPAGPAPAHAGLAPLSWRVEAALGAQAREARSEELRARLAQRVARKLSRARGLLAGLEQRAAAAADHERVSRDGELVKANLARLARGLSSVEVEDWFEEGAPLRRIALDPRLGPRENLERIFERAKKLERALGAVAGEIALARQRIAALDELARAAADPASDPGELDARAVERGLLDPPQEGDPRKREAPAPRLPYRAFAGINGGEIRVGRTARDNDELTLRHARGNDVWLHTADAPGSHVVLRVAKNAEPDPEDLLDAAHLAVHFSPLRASTRAKVHVARRKEVHKPRGAKPGLVVLSGGRILDVRVQPERLARLLRARPGAGGEDPAASG